MMRVERVGKCKLRAGGWLKRMRAAVSSSGALNLDAPGGPAATHYFFFASFSFLGLRFSLLERI